MEVVKNIAKVKGNGTAAKSFLDKKPLGQKNGMARLVKSFVLTPNLEDTFDLVRLMERKVSDGKNAKVKLAIEIMLESDELSSMLMGMRINEKADKILDCVHRIAHCDSAKKEVRWAAKKLLDQYRPGSGA